MSEPDTMSSEPDAGVAALAEAKEEAEAEAESKPLGLDAKLAKTVPLAAAEGNSVAGDGGARARTRALLMLADYSSESGEDSDGGETVAGPDELKPSVPASPATAELGLPGLQAPTTTLQPEPAAAADGGGVDTRTLQPPAGPPAAAADNGGADTRTLQPAAAAADGGGADTRTLQPPSEPAATAADGGGADTRTLQPRLGPPAAAADGGRADTRTLQPAAAAADGGGAGTTTLQPEPAAADGGGAGTKEHVTEAAPMRDVTEADGGAVDCGRDVTPAGDVTVNDDTSSTVGTADNGTKACGGDPPADEPSAGEAVELSADVMDTSDVQAEGDAVTVPDDVVMDREGLYRESLARPWSDDSEPDSDESEDSSDSSSESEVENKEEEAPKDEKRQEFGPLTKGELCLVDLPPIDHLHISLPEAECVRVGVVASIVGTLVVVQASPGTPALDIDSVLFLEKGQRPLGRVFDVMGQVQEPAYCVRFNAPEEIAEFGITSGADVFYAPGSEQHCHFVFVDALRKMRGTDASWWDSNEPPDSCRDFSDDEEERNHKRQNRKRPASDSASTSASTSSSTPSSSRGSEMHRSGGRGRASSRGGDGESGRRQRPPWMPAQPRNPFYRAGPRSSGPSCRPWGPPQHHHQHQHHQQHHQQPQQSWTPPAFSMPPPAPARGAFPPPAYPLFGQPPPSVSPAFGQPPPPPPGVTSPRFGGECQPSASAWGHAGPLTFHQPPPPPSGGTSAPFLQFPPPATVLPSSGDTTNQPPVFTLSSSGVSVNHAPPGPPSGGVWNFPGR